MKSFRYVALICLFLGRFGYAEAGTSVLMGVMGDSISAGTFANHNAVNGSHSLGQSSGKSVHLPPSSVVPFLGKWENKDTYSWASGQDLSSHFILLQNWLSQRDISLTVMNVAVPGSFAADLQDQANQLVQAMAGGQYSALEYVTIMIGANDACFSPAGTEADMQASLEQVFQTLASIQQSTPIHILVSSIPKIPDLGRAEITSTTTVGGLTCGKLRDRLIKECPLTAWTTQDEYDQNLARVDAKNQMLQNVVSEMQAKLPNLDIVYSSAFYDATILPAYLARDCFHPGQQGHQVLSQKLWNDQPWYK